MRKTFQGVDPASGKDFSAAFIRDGRSKKQSVSINTVAGGVCLGLWLFLLTLLPVAFCVWLVLMFLSHG